MTVRGTSGASSYLDRRREVMHDWVRDGLGIGLKASWDLLPELADGTIVQCLEPFWCDQIDLFAICANRTHQPPRIRAFLEFIAMKLPAMIRSKQ